MYLSDVCIKRPVFATVLSMTLVLFGAIGFQRLGVREYPATDAPVVSVTTNYAGANPDIIDAQVTEPLEQAINSVPGIRTLTSESREGRSSIRVEFGLGVDIEAAANDVRDKVSRAVDSLPEDVSPPEVEKADADSSPIIFMALTSETRDILEISHLADTVVKERIQTIPGVSAIRIFGERRYAMRLVMDPDKMAAHRVTPSDIEEALRRQNVELPSGRIEGAATELSLQTEGRLATPEQFDSMIIRQDEGRAVLFRDVGHAELSAENLRSGNRSLGVPMIGVAVIPQPNTNAIAIADEFYRRLDSLRAALPDDIKLDLGYDFTRFVRRSVVEVEETATLAFLLVIAIIFLFLRDWRSTLIPAIAIPVSIVASFFIMYVAGFTINILTLVAVVLSIGLVCDDAIVVLENIYAKIEQGLSPLRAALEGSREIYFAVVATTITLVAVFMPVIFLQGLTGRLFREFGVVIAGSVLASAFIALSLSPMMCRLLLRPAGQEGLLYRATEPLFTGLTAGYRFLLRGWMRAGSLLTLPVLGASAVAIVYAYSTLSQELAPVEDRSNIRVNLRAPEGASYDFTSHETDRVAAHIEDAYADEVHRVFALTGRGAVNQSSVNVYLKEPEERARTADQVLADISRDMADFTGVRAAPSVPPTIGDRRGGQPVQFVIQAPSLEAMTEVLPKFLDAASAKPALRFVDSDLKVNRPQIRLEIDRKRAAELGVSVFDVARTLQLAMADRRFGYFLRDGRQYQVIGQLGRQDRNDPSDLERLFIRASTGEMIPLNSLVTATETVSPAAIFRHNRFVSATISAGLAPGAALGDGIAAMEEVAEAVLPPGFGTDLAGQSKDFAESSSTLLYAFILALLLVYLVLAAQFESWVDPLVILTTVPLSLAGALLSLSHFGMTLNIFSQIGMIMLVGLVTKNGILIVEFANQRKAAGLSVREAVLQAAVARLRPILMTSLSTILGVLPIALALGAASSSRQSLGVAVVGGLVLSTVLTLFVVPAVYAFLSRERTPDGEEDAAEAPSGAREAAAV
ncbi:MAG: efflux RND transporter permease subunit [Candidatus Sumerlaeia bacterium]|nr:efflux RND transporter permease subunit [Candidatus Sumerlaeia bacterium]